ncbi:hypothetical protein [Lacticaseibacillus yichunensis]|uniref:Uncharacterized protein n=2 Tax=Lacticaseibacillus yichunensis TaxID=2486015 RepID=A0ABW4CMU8_9LACO
MSTSMYGIEKDWQNHDLLRWKEPYLDIFDDTVSVEDLPAYLEKWFGMDGYTMRDGEKDWRGAAEDPGAEYMIIAAYGDIVADYDLQEYAEQRLGAMPHDN